MLVQWPNTKTATLGRVRAEQHHECESNIQPLSMEYFSARSPSSSYAMSAIQRAERLATVVLTVCAVVLTVGFIRKEFFTPSNGASPPIERIDDWDSYIEGNMGFGIPRAPLHIIEFSDFECPACRKLHRTVQALRAKDSMAVRVTFRNYPLDDLHPSARAAATAAQCAANQGVFEPMHNYLFDHQAALGTVDWTVAAAAVGVADTNSFRKCLSADGTREAISRDSAAASRLSIDGTPLVMVNGRLFRGAPKAATLDSLLFATPSIRK